MVERSTPCSQKKLHSLITPKHVARPIASAKRKRAPMLPSMSLSSLRNDADSHSLTEAHRINTLPLVQTNYCGDATDRSAAYRMCSPWAPLSMLSSHPLHSSPNIVHTYVHPSFRH